MERKKLILPLLLILIITGCNTQSSLLFNKTEDFSVFNEQFHNDSTFQMSRIDFPVEGKKKTRNKKIKWTRDNWIIHKTPVGEFKNSDYETELTVKKDMVIEKIWIEHSEFYTERRFKRIKGKWYLVYFEDIN